MRATDETVRLIWEELVETDRMSRYFGYLAQRLDRRGAMLQVISACGASTAFVSLMSHFPDWVSAASALVAATASWSLNIRRYPEKAARSAEVCRLLDQVHLEWEHLWNGIWTKDDAELVSAWKALCERQATIVERAPVELPLSRPLARRSQRESDLYWSEQHA